MKSVPSLSITKCSKTQNALIILSILLLSSQFIIPFQLNGQTVPNQSVNSDYKIYENPDHKFSLLVPPDWTVTDDNNTIHFSSPPESEADPSQESLVIEVLSSGNIPLYEYVSLGIIELRQSLENFTLTHSDASSRISNNPAYEIFYTYLNDTTNYEAMRIWVLVGRETYTISYEAPADKFDSYLPLIQGMINSLSVQAPESRNEPIHNTAGLRLRDSPYSINVDASRNRLYAANFRSDSVSVIDGQNDNILADIKVGVYPTSIDVNPDSGRLFVVNRDSDSVSVIDGSRYSVLGNISVGDRPVDVVIDPNEEGSGSLIFVSNQDSDSVSVIDGSTNAVIATLNAREEPGDIALNPITNRLYVTNYRNNSVSIIDYHLSENRELKNETVANIQVGEEPASIELNPNTNRAYVSNSASDSVSVIDGSTNAVISNISVGTSPYSVAINTNKNLIYVANYLANSVSVIDGSTNQVISSIGVSRFPFVITYNPINRIAYVTHLSQNIVSMINNTDPVVGITFEINPSDSGYMICNEREFLNGDYLRLNINSTLDCTAVPNEGYSFSSWSGDLISTSEPMSRSSSETTFEVSKFGNATANFIVPIEFTLPREYWDQLTVILIGIIIPAIAGWSIPAIAGWLNGRRQRKHLRRYIARIYRISKESDSGHSTEYSTKVKAIKSDIENALTSGDISESQYDILNKKFSENFKSFK